MPSERFPVDLLTQVLATHGDGGPPNAEKLSFLEQSMHHAPRDTLAAIVDLTAHQQRRVDELRHGLEAAEENLERAESIIEEVMSPPWHPAYFMGVLELQPGQPLALVADRQGRRVVHIAEDVPAESLRLGDAVLLTGERNCITAPMPSVTPAAGETVTLDSVLEGGRLTVRHQGELRVALASSALDVSSLQPGDTLVWDSVSAVALHRVETDHADEYRVKSTPTARLRDVGGLDDTVSRVLCMASARADNADTARSYGIEAPGILLVGAPGVGKTLLGRIVAGELGENASFFVVKPGQFESMWVGETQRRMREAFAEFREAAERGPCVVFFDELESYGRIRGASASHIHDRHLGAFLTELDGFQEAGEVCCIAATNRKDLVAPALLERFNVEFAVPRPDMNAARAIFGIHLRKDFLFQPAGGDQEQARRELIETALSLLYAPNAAPAVCDLKFRDGSVRTVYARDLISGRVIASHICQGACQSAFYRHMQGGEPGICRADIHQAVEEALERMASTLTPGNCHAYLDDLPQDIDVVAVEPRVGLRAANLHRFIAAA